MTESRFEVCGTVVCSLLSYLALSCPFTSCSAEEDMQQTSRQPNIVFILTDDHRWDGLSVVDGSTVDTPSLDQICKQGVRFENAFVTLAICSPSRAACLTGRYGSANGVTAVGRAALGKGETTFAHALRDAGYATGVAGKWHLKTTPQACGFEFASTCWANGPWYNRKFRIDSSLRQMPGFVDDVAVDESLRFVDQACRREKPFALWLCTQVPHMDHQHKWPAQQRFLDNYQVKEMPVPLTWDDDLTGKPAYLKSARNRSQALLYGYDNPAAIRKHVRDYSASVQQMDASIGRLLDELKRRNLMQDTWIVLMGDNGWFLGEHGFTSKVLPYEESMRVPMAIAGPGIAPGVRTELVLNIDLTATIYELAGMTVPPELHGRSLRPLLDSHSVTDWRTDFLYEAPTPQLGSRPLWAVRNNRWKLVTTDTNDEESFVELYDIASDPQETENLAGTVGYKQLVEELSARLREHRKRIGVAEDRRQQKVDSLALSPVDIRTDLCISGVYPHLTTYGIYSQQGGHFRSGHNECGIGAVVPWADRLWMVNYAPHMPRGSEHKLFSTGPDLSEPLTVHPESVGGTPAGRMIHQESSQLLIGHHLIDSKGVVRTISPSDMPIRVTAIARHLKDPANRVYYIDMEGSIWEANVHTLDVRRLFTKPVPGWHGKGGYTSQGRLVISNNGELHVGDYRDVLVGGTARHPEERGVLAEYDGKKWNIVERRQFTEVTGPKGIVGGSDGDDAVWAVGWDRRSLRLKVLDDGIWYTYLLPKAAYCNDASHGWYTEWPRIRRITPEVRDGQSIERWMMDMHGMFYDFPVGFSAENSSGIRPVGSHLRYVPDFCDWNGRLVLASDETSIQGNRLAGQPQSNLWFGDYEDLKKWGPASGYGGPWVEDPVVAKNPSDPFLIAGFDRRIVHLAVGRLSRAPISAMRTTDQQPITAMPDSLRHLQQVSVERGDWHQPGAGFQFVVDQPVTVYLAVDRRGKPGLAEEWKETELSLSWGKGFRDSVYQRKFAAGTVEIPGNDAEHTPGSWGVPHMAFVSSAEDGLTIRALGKATHRPPETRSEPETGRRRNAVTFTLEVDVEGSGKWEKLSTVEVPDSASRSYTLPEGLRANWLRFRTDQSCVATAFLHQTASGFAGEDSVRRDELFSGLAEAADESAIGANLYAAKRSRDLRYVSDTDRCFEFSKEAFRFTPDEPDEKLSKLLEVEREFTIDDSSVVLKAKGKTYRLPRGHDAYNRPFRGRWPRSSREVQSERHLANIHGTFYEVPLVTNGAPPAWNLMRPVATHNKRIYDYCSWNGLLVLSGIRRDATASEHLFVDPDNGVGVWLGAIDDLWQLGKPVGDGGPWQDSQVRAGVPSDPYLMRGYDRKTVRMSHDQPAVVEITLQADIDGNSRWIDYQTFQVPAGQTITHRFPDAYSACWLRAVSNSHASVSVQLQYR